MNGIVFILIIMILILFAENIRELRRFQTTVYQIRPPQLEGLKNTRRVVFLSDLHNYRYGRENERLYDAIAGQNPDLILIGGDMLVRKNGNSYEQTVEVLRRLPALAPVYYANGNHEQKLKERPDQYEQSYKDYRERLEKSGIHFLENSSVKLHWDGLAVQITGLEIPLQGYEYGKKKVMSLAEIEKRVGSPSGASYQILLAHHPAYVKMYQRWGAHLILSGHLHGGIVHLPGIGGIVAPDFCLFPKYSGGIYRENGSVTVVSRGLGVHTIPLRILNPAELVVLEFPGDKACESRENLV